jgi:hypothetical protein
MATERKPEQQSVTETQRYWRDHLKRCAQSKQTMVEYAKAHNLKVTKLYYWSKRLRALGRLPAASSSVTFTPVKLISPAQSVPRFRVRFANGAIMEFDSAVQGAALEELLSVLSRLP